MRTLISGVAPVLVYMALLAQQPGRRDRVPVRVTLPGGREAQLAGLKVDRIVDLDIASRRERSAR